MRAFKVSAAALVLALWFGLAAAVVTWCVSYLFWGEYRTVNVVDDGEEPNCIGTWCTDGSWMRSPATYADDDGTTAITLLGDYEPGMQPEVLVGPLPGLGLPSRFEALFPLLFALPGGIGATIANIAFWSGLRDD
jgi:hypothetical protein